jgi:hypothetical protein
MNDPGQWLWGLLLLFMNWLWSIRYWILIGVAVVYAEKQVREMLSEAYADALNKTVVPVLEEIRDKLPEVEGE